MRTLFSFFVHRSLAVNLITVAVVVIGAIVAMGTTRTLLPPIPIHQLTVRAALPGASAVEMEREVTFRLEEALQGMGSVEEMTSQTRDGSSMITVVYDDAFDDMDGAVEQVRGRVESARVSLPRELEPIDIQRTRLSTMPLADVLVRGADETNPDHRAAVKRIEERLRRVSAVAEVTSNMRALDVMVRLDPDKLERRGVTAADVRRRLGEYLRYTPIGQVRSGTEDIAIELARPFARLQDLEKLPLVSNRVGRGVELEDVGTVAFEIRDERTRQRLDGEAFVRLGLLIDAESDTVTAMERVRDIVHNELRDELPPALSLELSQSTADLIEHEIEILASNGLGGVVIVVLVLLVFIGWRASVLTAIGLPFVYLGTVAVMGVLDVNFNLMSLLAMILVVGILVDDAILVAETFTEELKKLGDPMEAAVSAAMRVWRPVLGMMLTTTFAYLPILLIDGPMSAILRPLPLVVISALSLSLIESFLILPNHLGEFMSADALPHRAFMDTVRGSYHRALTQLMRVRALVPVVVALLFGAAGWLMVNALELDFAGIAVGHTISVYAELEESASLDETEAALAPVLAEVRRLPRDLVQYSITRTGSATVGMTTVEDARLAMVEISATGGVAESADNIEKIREELGPRLDAIEGFASLQLVETRGSEDADLVSVFVSGSDEIDFHELQDAIADALQEVPGVDSVFMDPSRFQRSMRFVADEQAVLAYGFGTDQISGTLREIFAQQPLVKVRLSGEEIELFTEVKGADQPTPERLGEVTLMSSRGVAVPLRFLGSWQTADVLRRIDHQDGLRRFQLDVLYDTDKLDIATVKERVEGALEPVREAYPGYYVSVEASEEEAETMLWAAQLALAAVFLVYLVLALSLDSLVQPLLIVIAVPFGLVGLVFALYAHGMPLSFMSAIGLLGLAGVVVNDSLVMVSTINEYRDEHGGDASVEATVEGASTRLQAVLITTLTTAGGVFPLAYGLGGQAGWIQPMVFALGWGLLGSTAMTLFFLPCLAALLEDVRGWIPTGAASATSPSTPSGVAD